MPYISAKQSRQRCHTEKDTSLYQSETLLVAVTSLQGWREEMEDAYCVLLPKNSALDKNTLDARVWRDENRSLCVAEDRSMMSENQFITSSISNMSAPPVFFSQGSGSVRFGTSVEVAATSAQSSTRHIASGSVHTTGPSRAGRVTLCGVFDGHGGAEVSATVAKKMGQWVLNSPSFSKNLYERALHEAFITNDATMRAEWNKNKDKIYGLAGSTANVILIVEEFSADVTRRVEQFKKAAGVAGATLADTFSGDAIPSSPQRVRSGIENLGTPSTTLPVPSSPGAVPGGPPAADLQSQNPNNSSFLLSSLLGAPLSSTQASLLLNAPLKHSAYDETKIICANAGDSRAILVRANGLVIPLSVDHKPSLITEKKRVIAAKGFVSRAAPEDCDRIDGILSVSRGFGDFMFKSNQDLPADRQLVIPNPDIRVTNQRKDAEGRYSYPWVRFGEPHAYSKALILKLNETRGVTKEKKAVERSGAEKDLLRLQKCLKWVPTAESTSTAGASTGAGHVPSPQSYVAQPAVSLPPSPQAGVTNNNNPAGSLTEKILLPAVLGTGVGISFEDATKPTTSCNNSLQAGEADRSIPPAKELCDPSATSAALFVAQACDGIWDCLTNNELSTKVLELLDEQITEILRARRTGEGSCAKEANLFRGIAEQIKPTLITEAIVDYCLQMSFSYKKTNVINSSQSNQQPAKQEQAKAHDVQENSAVPPGDIKSTDNENGDSLDKEEISSVTGIVFGSSPPIVGSEVEKVLAAAAASSTTENHAEDRSDDSPHHVDPNSDMPSSSELNSAQNLPQPDNPLSSTSPDSPSVPSADGETPTLTSSTTLVSNTPLSRRPPNYIMTSPTTLGIVASAKDHNRNVFVPRRPLNIQGTDNMTFVLIFFKDGIAARAMMLHQTSLEADRPIRSVEV